MWIGRNRSRGGFTLVEVLIALTLSSTVLIALMTVMASVLRSHIDTTLKGEVSAWTVLALDQLNREIGEASYINNPAHGGTGNVISGCTNFSKLLYDAIGEGRLDATKEVTAFYYCRSADIGGGMPALIRKFSMGTTLTCPASIPSGPCTPGAGAEVVIRNFHFRDNDGTQSPPLFRNRGDGIEMHFTVGSLTRPTSGAAATVAVPVNMKVDMFVQANRPFTHRPTDAGETD
ncbi:MAG: prepilin-type N-terminal cleavage/methylation domain-containing protein [Elusimicrobiota bacterium]|jgi:type II secretory pathway pseudopilin PulG